MTKSILLQNSNAVHHACRSPNRFHLLSLNLSRCCLNVPKDKDVMNIFKGHNQSLSLLGTSKSLITYKDKINSKFVVCSNVPPGTPLPSQPSSNPWNGWIIGIVLSMILPFIRGQKWKSLLLLKNQVEDIVQTVEDVVDAVENVANEVDKVVEDIGDDLPAGKLKNALKTVEILAENTAKSANVASDLIDKVQELDDKAEESVSSLVEMVTNKANKPTISEAVKVQK